MDIRKLIEENLDLMFRYAMMFTHNRQDAYDIVSEVVVKLMSGKANYEEQNAFKSWIFKVIRNQYLNISLKNQNLITNTEERLSNVVDIFSFQMPDPILREKILEAFKELPENFADVLYLVDVEGYTYEEAAEALGIPLGTVMSRLHRARAILREKLFPIAKEMGIVNDKQKR